MNSQRQGQNKMQNKLIIKHSETYISIFIRFVLKLEVSISNYISSILICKFLAIKPYK
jgi:hypothetical protein